MDNNKVKEAKVVVEKKTNGFAIAGFVISLISSCFCCGALNFLGIIFSIVGINKAKEIDGEGKGLAIAGLVIGIVFLVIYVLWVLIFGGLMFLEGISE